MIKARHIAAGISATLLISGTVLTTAQNVQLNKELKNYEASLKASQHKTKKLSSRLSDTEALYDELVADYKSLDIEYAKTLNRFDELQESYNELSDSQDIVTIYDIALSTDLQKYTYATCKRYGISDYYELMLALMKQESDYNANCISSTNDYGLCQINMSNYVYLNEELGVTNLLDSRQNIQCGVYMLSENLKKANYDVTTALMYYNMGVGGATKLIAKGTTGTNYSRGVLNHYTAIKNQ